MDIVLIISLAIVIAVVGVCWLVWKVLTPSKLDREKMLIRQEERASREEDRLQEEKKILLEKEKLTLPRPAFDPEEFPYVEGEENIWACGWREDEVTGHRTLTAYGVGIDTDNEPVALKLWYSAGETTGIWQMGLLYEGLSLRGKLVTLYLLVDGKRFKTHIEGSGHQKQKGASFCLTDPQLLRALVKAREIKYVFAEERGELLPGATEGFRRLGGFLYPDGVPDEWKFS